MTTPQVTLSAEPDTYVLLISHRHGDDTTLHPTEAAARAALAGFARQWWHEIADPEGDPVTVVTGPPADDDDEVIRIYFEHQDDESYVITPATMPRPGEPGRRPGGDGHSALMPRRVSAAAREHLTSPGGVLTGRIINPREPLPDTAALDLITGHVHACDYADGAGQPAELTVKFSAVCWYITQVRSDRLAQVTGGLSLADMRGKVEDGFADEKTEDRVTEFLTAIAAGTYASEMDGFEISDVYPAARDSTPARNRPSRTDLAAPEDQGSALQPRYACVSVKVRVPADLRHEPDVAADIAVAAQKYADETYGRDELP